MGLDHEVDARTANRVFLQRLQRLEVMPAPPFTARDLEWALQCFEDAARGHVQIDAMRVINHARELAIAPRVVAQLPVTPLPRRTAPGESIRAVDRALCAERLRRLASVLEELTPPPVACIDPDAGVDQALGAWSDEQADAAGLPRTHRERAKGHGGGSGRLSGLRNRLFGNS